MKSKKLNSSKIELPIEEAKDKDKLTLLSGALSEMNNGLKKYFQRTLKELGDIKTALDQVLAVSICDPSGSITYVNDRFCQLYKYSREEVIGKTHRLFKSGEHDSTFYQNLWNTVTLGQIFSSEIKNRAKDGSSYWAYMVIVPFLDESGKPYQYVSFRTDITPVKNAQAERIKLIKAESAAASAEEAVQARDRFVSMAAHELKTPLTSLQLVLDLLISQVKEKHDPEELAQIHRLLDTASSQTKRLHSIINDLLDVSRMTAGQLKLNLDFVNLGELLKNLLSHFKEDFESAGCPVTLEVEDEIRGIWDRARLEQAIINLISNALKYGLGKPIHIAAKRDQNYAEVRIQDRGIGIPKEFLEKLFQRFERSETAKHYHGVGLGLWITHQIVEAHQGKIYVESEMGQGSTFTIRLPIREKEVR